jgi:hypothetical protein
MGYDAILDNLQPSLRDSIMSHDVPRTSVLIAKFSRPCGTKFVHPRPTLNRVFQQPLEPSSARTVYGTAFSR